MTENLDRRDFLTGAAAAGFGLSLLTSAPSARAARAPLTSPAPDPLQAPPLDKVRIGFIGVGSQGTSHVRNFLKIDKVEIKALCDIVPAQVAKSQDLAVKAGKPKPQAYTNGDHDFLNLVARDDLDLVFIATPWEWHVPMCVAAMKAGKHAAVEVPASYTLDGCWELVETAEATRRHCVMMENMCYGRFELLTLNMVRHGLLGEVLHGECGYLHDLRALKMSTRGEGIWRRAHNAKRNGNLYPTHGLGPMANCMDINRGDAFDFLVSVSCNSRGLELYAADHFPPADPRRKERYIKGDVNASIIRTKRGRSIIVTHDTDNPRPYSRVAMLQGTRGIMQGYPDPLVYIEGKSAKNDLWDKADPWYEKYEHPLWKKEGSSAQGAGHGGADYLEDWRLVQALLRGEPTDFNVYDAAALSAVCELSETSVANRSRSVDFPDFTRGRWQTAKPWTGIAG